MFSMHMASNDCEQVIGRSLIIYSPSAHDACTTIHTHPAQIHKDIPYLTATDNRPTPPVPRSWHVGAQPHACQHACAAKKVMWSVYPHEKMGHVSLKEEQSRSGARMECVSRRCMQVGTANEKNAWVIITLSHLTITNRISQRLAHVAENGYRRQPRVRTCNLKH
ncbi:hypothetical protein EJ02DRAFT_57333 [Clathrospora elynae]|uniref:Uncharacterized protein n=1 Tax=Clathrospora elynae TaxID=706981 RepID=A0A6A5SCD2_9PLEO|nr:hypothetical protein EJ02DRAFT_57333 [Clathrospora elynae]